MKSDQFWTAVSKALTTLTVMLIVTVVLASGAAAASQYKVLHTFTWASTLYGGLTFDAAGNLYGTTEGGGAYGYGVVFKLTHDPDGSWTESTLFSFTGGSDGGNPWDVPTFDAAGNLYGTTTSGGLGYGTVFKLTPNPDAKWTESVVYRFTGGDDGETPMAGLILDGAGNLYGTTYTGGNYGAGTVFKLTPNLGGSWTQTVLHHFTGSDGSNIVAGVISDATGNLYGAATRGGADGSGVVFKLKPNPDGSWTQSVLHTFAGGSDGTYPDHGSLVLDGHGNLYGATADGGTGSCSFVGLPGCGAIFELTPNPDGTWTEHMLH